MNQDEQYLKILAIFHFVVAGMSALSACIPIIHFVAGLGMLVTSLSVGISEGVFSEAVLLGLMGLVFALIAGIVILCGWAFAVCVALAGLFLLKKKRHMFCVVMGGVECMFMPFGTVLGVFTVIMLMRPAVKAMFGISEAIEESPAV
ncbi:MAG: hypothetical protein AB8I69_21120 [Anaerolineae bacterium]|jgi:hypothetical protein